MRAAARKVPPPMLYDGGESSRIYEGMWQVLYCFTWPDGEPGFDWSEQMIYEDAMSRLRLFGIGFPVTVSDGKGEVAHVHVTRAVIVRA